MEAVATDCWKHGVAFGALVWTSLPGTLGRSLFTETSSDGHPLVAVSSQVRTVDRRRTISELVGSCELSAGYGS